MHTTTTPDGGWTFQALADAKLPLPLSSYEVVDGRLLVRPEMTFAHYDVAYELAKRLDAALPSTWRARTELGVELGRNGRRADFGVVRTGLAVRRRQMGVSPADVAMLGEVVSPTGTGRDRVVKPAEYAAAGIASYWRLELYPEPLLVVHQLVGAGYVAVQSLGGRGTVVLPLAHPESSLAVELDLPALLPPLLD